MVYSMTAYASREVSLPNGTVRWELRSLNHRYLELAFKLPEWLQETEGWLRETVRKHLNRGKVDCCLRLDLEGSNSKELILDTALVKQLSMANQQIKQQFPEADSLSVFEVLRWPGVIRDSNQNFLAVKEKIQDSFVLVLKDLISARNAEGEKIKLCFEERLDKMQGIMNDITARLPEIEKNFQFKLKEKLEELNVEINMDRFNQEIIYYFQKMNIAEEVDRLKIHLVEAQRVLSVEQSIGRRLDFLMQEINREVNTMASKTIDNAVAQDCIELKILLEELREQTHNLE